MIDMSSYTQSQGPLPIYLKIGKSNSGENSVAQAKDLITMTQTFRLKKRYLSFEPNLGLVSFMHLSKALRKAGHENNFCS